MDDPQVFTFPFKDVVTALIRQAGFKEGKWALYAEFGIGAANIGDPTGTIRPAAIVPVMKLGLRRVEALDELSVDAAALTAAATSAARKPKRLKRKHE